MRNPTKRWYSQEGASTYWWAERASGGGGCCPPACSGQKPLTVRSASNPSLPPLFLKLDPVWHPGCWEIHRLGMPDRSTRLFAAPVKEGCATHPSCTWGWGESTAVKCSAVSLTDSSPWLSGCLCSLAVPCCRRPAAPSTSPCCKGNRESGGGCMQLPLLGVKFRYDPLIVPKKTSIPLQIKCINATNISVRVCSKYTLSI